MIKELICITCPMGCHLSAELNDKNEVTNISGNSCPRGAIYARKELVRPERVLTTTVKINNALHRLLPVNTSGSLAKQFIFDAMKIIADVEVEAPINCGDIIIKNIGGSGVDVVASRTMERIDN